MVVKIKAENMALPKEDATATRDKRVNREAGQGQRNLVQRNFEGERINAFVALHPGVVRNFKVVPAKGSAPEYRHVKVHNVDIHLRDGLEPLPDGEIRGSVQVKVRVIQPKGGGGHVNYYLYMNVFPLKEGEQPTHKVCVEQIYDSAAFETLYIPHGGQQVMQGTICVARLA